MGTSAQSACVVICLTLCSGSRSARAQEASEPVCVDATVIRQCELDAREADRLEMADKRARECQRQLDTTDGGLQECQRHSGRSEERQAARLDLVTREAARATIERDRRPEWPHVAMFVAGALLLGVGTGYILGGL